jgi:hypothetical protein
MSPPVAVVAGAIANKLYQGGEAWVRLGWALGLRTLGYDVYLLEELDRAASAETLQTSEEAAYFLSVASEFGFDGRAALRTADGRACVGLDRVTARQIPADADLLVNISGHLPLSGATSGARRKVYVDVDPGYTQLWHAQGLDAKLDGHDAFVTVGLAVGSSVCGLPTGGLDWTPTLPPIALDEWPGVPPSAEPTFTTVASWRGSYGRVEHEGVLYGQKAHEFRRFLELPRHVPFAFELALAIDEADEADRASLLAAGWRLVDPRAVAGDPKAYRRYVQGSGAEFSVAQGVYVASQCGWFSDRTGAYLASGRPALVQDTGIGGGLPGSEGLVTFATIQEATAGAREIVRNLDARSEAARAFAEEHLDAAVVVGRLLERLEKRA